MKKILLVLALMLSAPAALADEEPVSPTEFREYSEGYTLYFEKDGEPFGSERFEAGGKSRWRYNDGSCVRGAWREHGAQVCFLYESEGPDEREVLCWRMLRDEQGMFARLVSGENAGLELRVTGRDRKPLLCGDPATST